jgi:hypothetical protein
MNNSDGETELSARAPAKLKVTDLGPDPGYKNHKKYFTTYCSKPYKKKGKREDEDEVDPVYSVESVDERSLEARAMPAGYTDVAMGAFRGASATEPGLYSGLFGTCVGIVITGTPKTATGKSRFVAHLAMGSWAEMKAPYATFMEAVIRADMSNMRAWIYQIDTTLAKDPSLRNDPDMQNESAGIASVYKSVKARLQALIGSTHAVAVATHSWEHTGEISVSPAGVPTFALA